MINGQDLQQGNQPTTTTTTADVEDDNSPNNKNHLQTQTTGVSNNNNNNNMENNKVLLPPPNLDPPLSSGEKMRDALLRTLDSAFFQYLGIAVLVGIVASGAVFFFFLMGWQTLCRPRTDCQPRNDIYNISIQFLNGFFTYTATMSMPWRCVNFLHTSGWACPYRKNAPGHDLYGQETDDVWFHVPLRKRMVILFFLLWNCLTQYANQVTRIVYYNYDLQNEFPGNMWVNIFFGLSMICAAIGGSLMGYHTGKVRATDPDRFGAGPIELAQDMWNTWRNKNKQQQASLSNKDAAVTEQQQQQQQQGGAGDAEDGASPSQANAAHQHRRASEAMPEFDPTRAPQRRSVIDVNRSSMRMFAL